MVTNEKISLRFPSQLIAVSSLLFGKPMPLRNIACEWVGSKAGLGLTRQVSTVPTVQYGLFFAVLCAHRDCFLEEMPKRSGKSFQGKFM